MAMVATDIKSMLSISIKSRHDSYTDQYNRIFMVKMLLVSSLIMGISWFQDSIHCMVPGIFQRLHTYMFCLVVSFVCLFFFFFAVVCYLAKKHEVLSIASTISASSYLDKPLTPEVGFDSAQN